MSLERCEAARRRYLFVLVYGITQIAVLGLWTIVCGPMGFPSHFIPSVVLFLVWCIGVFVFFACADHSVRRWWEAYCAIWHNRPNAAFLYNTAVSKDLFISLRFDL